MNLGVLEVLNGSIKKTEVKKCSCDCCGGSSVAGGIANVLSAVGTTTLHEAMPNDTIVVDATLGDVDITLSASSVLGARYNVIRIDNSAFSVRVLPAVGCTINGLLFINLMQYDSLEAKRVSITMFVIV